jgi:hypothetical protein
MIEDLPEIEKDKANHFIYGLLIYFIITLFFGDLVGIVVCFLVAIGKEIYDHYSPLHHFDWWDFIWTIAGGLIGFYIHIS